MRVVGAPERLIEAPGDVNVSGLRFWVTDCCSQRARGSGRYLGPIIQWDLNIFMRFEHFEVQKKSLFEKWFFYISVYYQNLIKYCFCSWFGRIFETLKKPPTLKSPDFKLLQRKNKEINTFCVLRISDFLRFEHFHEIWIFRAPCFYLPHREYILWCRNHGFARGILNKCPHFTYPTASICSHPAHAQISQKQVFRNYHMLIF